MKSIPERRFHRMLRDKCCTWTATGSNEHAIQYKGELVCFYGVWHSRGAKREISMFYVKRFLKQLAELKSRCGEA